MTFTIYAKSLGTGTVNVSLKPEYRVEYGQLTVPDGTVPHFDGIKEYLVIPGHDGPMELGYTTLYGCMLNPDGVVWTAGPTPKP